MALALANARQRAEQQQRAQLRWRRPPAAPTRPLEPAADGGQFQWLKRGGDAVQPAVKEMVSEEGVGDGEPLSDDSGELNPGPQVLECPICLEPLASAPCARLCRLGKAACPHVLHEVCVARCLPNRGQLFVGATSLGRCPLCREPFDSLNLI